MEQGRERPLVGAALAVAVAVTLLVAATPPRDPAGASVPVPKPRPLVDPLTVVARGSAPVVAAGRPSVVAFTTDAPLPGDRRGIRDVYVRDGSTLTRVSRGLRGFEAGPADQPAISADGAVVAYRMMLQPSGSEPGGEGGPAARIVVHDRRARATRLLVAPPYLDQQQPAISPDGRVVAFVAERRAGEGLQVLAVDLVTGQMALVSARDGRPGNGASTEPAVSHSGRVIAFTSEAGDLGPDGPDVNGARDVYVARDVLAGPASPLLRITDAAPGRAADGPSAGPSVSDDGRLVAFHSSATNLLAGDTNATTDVFVRDLASGALTMASVAPDGSVADGPSRDARISGDGRSVAFTSAAGNLVDRTGPGGRLRAAPTPTNFALVDPQGLRTYGSAATTAGTTVRVAFPQEAIDAAVGATVDEGAVVDGQLVPAGGRHGRSNANPVGTVAVTPGAALSTAAPDLLSARVASPTTVRFCFDEPVAEPVAGRFLVQHPDSARTERAVEVTMAEPRCVVARFAGGRDISRFSLGVSLEGAVAGPAPRSRPAVQAGVPLTRGPGGPGVAATPILVGVDPVSPAEPLHLRFRFDQPVVGPVARRFGYTTAGGADATGLAVARVDGPVVVVAFASAVPAAPGPVRAFALAGAARGAGGEAVALQAVGAPVAGRPDLVSVSRPALAAPDGDWAFSFDEAVAAPDPAGFQLVAEDATAVAATRAVVDATRPRVVLARFGSAGLGGPSGAAAGAAVSPGAVTSGTAGSAVLEARTAEPGRTDGPDLVAADFRREAGAVTFRFDEAVHDVQLSPARPRFDDGPASQVYARDLARPRTVAVTTATGGRPSGAGSASVSHDGRVVTFARGAPSGLVVSRDLLAVSTGPAALRFEPDDQLRTVVVTNRGFGRLRPGGAQLVGPAAGDYRISSNTCAGGLFGPSQSCFVVVALQPGRSGPRHATLMVSDGSPAGPMAVELSAGSLITRASNHCSPTAGSIPCPPEEEIDPCGPPPPIFVATTLFEEKFSEARVPDNPCPTIPTSTSTSTTTTSTSTSTTTTSTSTTTTTTTTATIPPTTTTSTTRPPPVIPDPGIPEPEVPPPSPPAPLPEVPRPRLVLDPPLGEPGKVTSAIGTGYPANADVVLTWSRGLGGQVARTDGSGRFRVPVLIFHKDQLGPRTMTGAAAAASATAPFLVVPGSLIPGDFVIRR